MSGPGRALRSFHSGRMRPWRMEPPGEVGAALPPPMTRCWHGGREPWSREDGRSRCTVMGLERGPSQASSGLARLSESKLPLVRASVGGERGRSPPPGGIAANNK